MDAKENDWLLNKLNNPSFTNTDFKAVGIDADNTSLLDRETYKNSDAIRNNPMMQTDGKFDEVKFNAIYDNVAASYNKLSEDTYNEDAMANAVYHRDNIFISPEQRQEGPQIGVIQTFNPYKQTKSLIEIGQWGPVTKSDMEIAKTQKVLANPVEVEKGAAPIWQDAPEESWFDNFFETRVLAQWDYDADKDGNPTDNPDEIVYYKGSPKYNDAGTFYFENLDGRSIYGRRVLSKMDTLTKEDSWLHKYDFFDSSGLEKSLTGSIMKNVATIVPMLIPGVGNYYIAATFAEELLNLGAVLGKMVTSSDNTTLNGLEGFLASLKPSVSQHAMEHPWCLENMVNMAGDTFKFLYAQRWLFEKAPALIKGEALGTEEAQNAKMAKWIQEISAKKRAHLNSLTGLSAEEYAIQEAAIPSVASSEARALMGDMMKEYQKMGEVISRAYMASTFGASMYGEAKTEGLSDNEAAAITLGYMAGQWGMLSSHIGKWVFPELKLDKKQREVIAKKIIEGRAEIQFGEAATENVSKAAKEKWFKRWFDKGVNVAKQVYSPATTATKATFAGVMAGGVEMSAFELLHDLTTSTFNLYSWLSGSDSKMTSFEDVGQRYLTGFVGGAMGGLFFAPMQNYKQAKEMLNMDYDRAMQQLVFMGRNGLLDKFSKETKKMILGNKNQSSTYTINSKGERVWTTATAEDNMNVVNHKRLDNLVDMIKRILKAEGGEISDTTLMSKAVRDDLRFEFLKNSQTILSVSQDFNTLMTEIIRCNAELNELNTTAAKMERGETDKQEREGKVSPDKRKADLEAKLKDLEERKEKFLSGELSGDYIRQAIFEMNLALNEPFIQGYFRNWVENKTGKKYDDISLSEIAHWKDEYKTYCQSNRIDVVRKGFKLFEQVSGDVSELLKGHLDELTNTPWNIESLQEKYGHLIESFNLESDPEKLNMLLALLSNKELSLTELIFNPGKEFLVFDEDTSDGSTSYNYSDYNSLFDSRKAILEELKNEYETKNPTPERQKEIEQEYGELLQITNEQASKITEYNDSKINELLARLIDENGEFKHAFINPELKDRLISDLNHYSQDLLKRINNSSNASVDLYNKIDKAINVLKEVPNTPIMESLSKFGLKYTGQQIDIAELLHRFNEQYDKLSDLSDFFSDPKDLDTIDTALQLIQMFKSGIFATEKSPLRINNLFAYNTAVNELVEGSNLTELEPEVASFIHEDLDAISNKLKFYRKLVQFNSSQKLKESDRVGNGLNFQLYKKAEVLVRAVNKLSDDWKDKDKLEKALNELDKTKEMVESGSLSLSPDQVKQLYADTLKFKNAVYDFFQANADNMKSPEKLAELINCDNFTFFKENQELKTTLLDTDIKGIDDASYIYMLATWASVKPSDFIYTFKNKINENIAPIPTHLLALETMYAYYTNQPMMKLFQDAMNYSIEKKYSLTGIKLHEHQQYQRYGVAFIDGIAGAGKSTLLQYFAEMINSDPKHKLKNVWVASPVNGNSNPYKQLTPKLKFDKSTNVISLTKEGLMKKLSPDWKEEFDANGDLVMETSTGTNNFRVVDGKVVSPFELQAIAADKIPDVIIIDELGYYSSMDLDLINRFHEEYGVPVITLGDLNQSKIYGEVKIGNTNFNAEWVSTQMVHIPKMGLSLRARNIQQNRSEIELRLFGEDPQKYSPTLHYYQGDDGSLYGTRMLVSIDTEYSKEIDKAIDDLVNTLQPDEKIGFIYTDENSELYKKIDNLSPDKKDKFVLYKGNAAQGLEEQYIIVESIGNSNKDKYISNLYTAVTRAKQGVLFITDGSLEANDEIKNIQNVKDEFTIETPLDKKSISAYSAKIKAIFEELVPDGTTPTFIPLINPNAQSATGQNSLQQGNQGGTNPPNNQPPVTPPSNPPANPQGSNNSPNNNGSNNNGGTQPPSNNGANPPANNQPSNNNPANNANNGTNNNESRNLPAIIYEPLVILNEENAVPGQTPEEIIIVSEPIEPKAEAEKTIDTLNNKEESKPVGVVPNSKKEVPRSPNNSTNTQKVDSLSSIYGNVTEVFGAKLYTEFSHEIGAVVDSTGKITESVEANYRFDGINGLARIAGYGGDKNKRKGTVQEFIDKSEITIDEYIEAVETIKSIVWNNRDNLGNAAAAIITELEKPKYNGHFKEIVEGLKGNELTISWKFKSASKAHKSTSSSSWYKSYYKDGVKEKQYENFGHDINSEDVNYKHVCIWIDAKDNGNTKHLLELPFLTLPHPEAVMSKELKAEYKKIYPKYIDPKTGKYEKDGQHKALVEFRNTLLKLIRDNKAPEGALTLAKLIEVYNFTQDGVFDIPAEAISTLIDQGPTFTAEGTGSLAKAPNGAGLISRTGYIPLQEFAKKKSAVISEQVYVSTEDILDYSGSVAIRKGIPFVIIGSAGEDRATLLNKYLAQICKDTNPQSLTRQYVSAPRVTIEEYFENLAKIKRGKKDFDNIGNLFTNIELARILFHPKSENNILKSKEYEGKLKSLLGNDIDKIIKILEEIDNTTGKDAKERAYNISKLLQRKIKTHNGNEITQRAFIRQTLISVYEGTKGKVTILDYLGNEINFHSLVGNAIITAQRGDHVISFNLSIDQSKLPLAGFSSGKGIYAVEDLENYQLKTKGFGNRDLGINGKVDTREVYGNISGILDAILGKVYYEKSMGHSLDEESYLASKGFTIKPKASNGGSNQAPVKQLSRDNINCNNAVWEKVKNYPSLYTPEAKEKMQEVGIIMVSANNKLNLIDLNDNRLGKIKSYKVDGKNVTVESEQGVYKGEFDPDKNILTLTLESNNNSGVPVFKFSQDVVDRVKAAKNIEDVKDIFKLIVTMLNNGIDPMVQRKESFGPAFTNYLIKHTNESEKILLSELIKYIESLGPSSQGINLSGFNPTLEFNISDKSASFKLFAHLTNDNSSTSIFKFIFDGIPEQDLNGDVVKQKLIEFGLFPFDENGNTIKNFDIDVLEGEIKNKLPLEYNAPENAVYIKILDFLKSSLDVYKGIENKDNICPIKLNFSI